jgi:hypothetical protein
MMKMIMKMTIIKSSNHMIIVRETRLASAAVTMITRRNLIGLDLSSCGITPRIYHKNRYCNGQPLCGLMRKLRQKNNGFYFACLILAGSAKKGSGDRSEKKWGWRCISALPQGEKYRED